MLSSVHCMRPLACNIQLVRPCAVTFLGPVLLRWLAADIPLSPSNTDSQPVLQELDELQHTAGPGWGVPQNAAHLAVAGIGHPEVQGLEQLLLRLHQVGRLHHNGGAAGPHGSIRAQGQVGLPGVRADAHLQLGSLEAQQPSGPHCKFISVSTTISTTIISIITITTVTISIMVTVSIGISITTTTIQHDLPAGAKVCWAVRSPTCRVQQLPRRLSAPDLGSVLLDVMLVAKTPTISVGVPRGRVATM